MDNPFERALESFIPEGEAPLPEKTVEVKKPAPQQESALIKAERREMMNPFGLVRQLFDFCEDNISENAGSQYSDLNGEYEDNPYAKELPPKFLPIIADYPGTYYVVAYENRLSSYYVKGTNFRSVQLSTVQKMSQTDEKIREIQITEPAASEGQGNILLYTVKDLVKQKSRADINTAEENKVDAPHGSAKLTYRMNPVGEKKLIASKFNRLDESMFEWKGEQAPVRWVRNLEIENQDADNIETRYEDMYIIGRHHQRADHKDTRVQVRMTTVGKLDDPQLIHISIGLPIGDPGRTLYEDKERNINIVSHDNSWTSPEDEIEILKTDPNYAFLFEQDVDRNKIIELLRQKAHSISNEWDKATTVFASNALEEGNKVIE